jgi:3-deoxy-manno-octulosonate cytidylyltransferase (CMP-KDO synthetase)
MSTLAVIPARLAASRLPGKPLRLLAGKPLVIRVWERVTALGVADDVVIATDHPDIMEAARKAGAACEMTKSRHESGTDRVAEVVSRLPGARAILNVQGDEPFVGEDALRGALDMVSSGAFPIGTAAAPLDDSILARPDVVKVVTDDGGRAMYFSRAAIPFLRDDADAATRRRLVKQHIGVYAYTPDALAAWVALPVHPLERVERLEQLRPLAAGWQIGVASARHIARGVDTEEDLAHANEIWNEFSAGKT